MIIVLVVVAYAKYIKKEKVISIGKYSILIVLSESMEPTIEEKEMILIKKQDNYDVDDIVTYLSSNRKLITHRITQIDEYSFIAKGDNNNIVDENNVIDNIKGKVVFHSKILGIFLLYYLKPLIIVYFIFLVILISWKYLKKENKDEEE